MYIYQAAKDQRVSTADVLVKEPRDAETPHVWSTAPLVKACSDVDKVEFAFWKPELIDHV
jgi:hypothetical protein